MRRWFDEPEFQRAYTEARKKIVDRAVAAVQVGAEASADRLRRIIGSKSTTDRDAISAARILLNLAFTRVDADHIDPARARERVLTQEDVLRAFAESIGGADAQTEAKPENPTNEAGAA